MYCESDNIRLVQVCVCDAQSGTWYWNIYCGERSTSTSVQVSQGLFNEFSLPYLSGPGLDKLQLSNSPTDPESGKLVNGHQKAL